MGQSDDWIQEQKVQATDLKSEAAVQHVTDKRNNSFSWSSLRDLNCNSSAGNDGIKKKFANFLSEEQILRRTQDCGTYFSQFPVLDHLKPEAEAASEMPLALSHLIHHEVGIFEVFMALFFRPHNMHCIHIDKKASPLVRRAVEDLVACYRERFYPNDKEKASNQIFVLKEADSEVVFWGESSILRADIACLRQLLINDHQSSHPWKYFLNTAGSELPLRTDRWTRQMLQGLDPKANVVESFPLPSVSQFRIQHVSYLKW